MSKDTQTLQLYVSNVNRCMIMSSQPAKVSNPQLQETNGREKTLKLKKSANLFRRLSETMGLSTTTATGSSSLLITVQARPHWPPTALSGPFCLHTQSSEQQGC